METVESTPDDRAAKIKAVEDKAAEFLALIESLRTPPVAVPVIDTGHPNVIHDPVKGRSVAYTAEWAVGTIDVDLIRAEERIIEATMWAVRHIKA